MPLSDYHRIVALHKHTDDVSFAKLLLPRETLTGTVFPGTIVTVVALFAVYSVFFQLFKQIGNIVKRRKMAYQCTNLIMNATLGMLGLYVEFFVLPTKNTPIEETINGFHEYLYFSYMQLGFNLYSIPMGMLFVHESKEMILHHFGVIFVTFMTGFTRNGFRYWTPFFFGAIEASSVPLSIMNSFKDNPDWTKAYPGVYQAVRLIFAGSFLILRVAMFLPRHMIYLQDQFVFFSTHSNRLYQAFMAIVWICSVFLLILQIFWGGLIVRNIVKLFIKKQKKKVV